jgi:ABC-type uncharacterized transport system ATPase subunit
MRPRGHRDVARVHPHARLSTTEYSSTLPAMIEVDMSMRYGEEAAVEELAFSDKPGLVTGLQGPDEAGKTTTMHLILGLDS